MVPNQKLLSILHTRDFCYGPDYCEARQRNMATTKWRITRQDMTILKNWELYWSINWCWSAEGLSPRSSPFITLNHPILRCRDVTALLPGLHYCIAATLRHGSTTDPYFCVVGSKPWQFHNSLMVSIISQIYTQETKWQ
jgi:hypothetical protein